MENQNEQVTVYLSGEIDHHSARDIREQIDMDIDRSFPKILRMDFKDVTFMDSSGIGLIMGRYKHMKAINGEVVIANPSSYLKRIFCMAGINQLVSFED